MTKRSKNGKKLKNVDFSFLAMQLLKLHFFKIFEQYARSKIQCMLLQGIRTPIFFLSWRALDALFALNLHCKVGGFLLVIINIFYTEILMRKVDLWSYFMSETVVNKFANQISV